MVWRGTPGVDLRRSVARTSRRRGKHDESGRRHHARAALRPAQRRWTMERTEHRSVEGNAADLKIPFEFREYDYDLTGLLNAVERRQIDVAVAAIPVALEGEARFDFTHPYFAAGLGIAVHTEPQGGVLATLAGFFTYQVIAAIAALLAGLLLVGMLMWLAERRQKAHFDARPMHGIADG